MLDQSFPIEDLPKHDLVLVKNALRVQKKAYAPYSDYLVGCALWDKKGRLFTGCNVENASFGATCCAERAAIVKMVSRGGRVIKKLVVVTSSEEPVFPCGMCLQVIQEFGLQAEIIAVNKRGTLFKKAVARELFPFAFDPKKLKI